MSHPSPSIEGLTGRHVLFGLVAFFAVVFAANAYFITVALSTHTGVVANEPYRKGLKYNERIAAAARQDSLGWTHQMTLAPDAGQLAVDIKDGAQKPIGGLAITATIGRPATSQGEVHVRLEETRPGHYEAATGLSEGGAYIASLEAEDPLRSDQGVVYRARTRLWLER